jgi:hypothetical protein
MFWGILALGLVAYGTHNRFGVGYWFKPLLYITICLCTLLIDILLKIGIRQATQPRLLIPFLVLLIVPLAVLWYRLGSLGLVYWAIVAVVYCLILSSFFYALFVLAKQKG